MQDTATLQPHDVSAGDNDLRAWHNPESRVDMEISTSRTDHLLRVRHPNGEFFNITPLGDAGNLTLGSNRVLSEVPYYYFNATSLARSEMPWYVEDLDTGERLGFGTGETHPGNDALIMWIAVAPPHSLTATADQGGVGLDWVAGDSATDGGFIIERRESMNTNGPFTRWHELDRVPGDHNEYRDTRLAPGEYAIYRVRAFYGEGAAERRSTPSNLARAARWIRHDDDTYGPPPGNVGGGTGPVIDPPGGGGGGGGGDPVIDGDGDGDGDPDNDDDGVVDINDRYPNDPRRNDDVAVAFHGVIDLNKYLTTSFTLTNTEPISGAGAGPLITIGDNNHVAWAGICETETFDPLTPAQKIKVLRIVTWVDGVAVNDVSIPLTQTGFGSPPGGGTARDFVRRITISPVGISVGSASDGSDTRVAGNAWATTYWKDPIDKKYAPEASVHPQGTFDCYGDSNAVFSIGRIGPFPEYQRLSRDGHLFWLRRWHENTGAGKDWQQAMIDQAGVLPQESMNMRTRTEAISDAGHTVLRNRPEEGSPDSRYLCSPDGTQVQLSLTDNQTVAGINDQKWVVGDKGESEDINRNYDDPTPSDPSHKRKGRGRLGFVLENGTGTLRTFHDLLPKEYRNQLQSAVPTMISNAEAHSGKPRILFGALDWEEEPGQWVPRALILSWNASGEPVLDRVMLPAVVDPVTHEVREYIPTFAAWNKQRDIAGTYQIPSPTGTATAAGATPPVIPGILRISPFQANMPFSEGFDPPMPFDVNPLTTPPQRDEEDWVPWTSVAKSGDLHTNNRTKLHFPPNSPVWQYEIVATGEEGVAYPNPAFGLISVVPGAPSSTDTVLTIHGNPGDDVIRTAMVLIRMNDTTHQEVWRMKVKVLPPSGVIGLAFYNEPGTNTTIATPAAIAAEINDRFAPTAVSVVATHAAWEGNSSTHHDGDCTVLLVDHIKGGGGTDRGICPPGEKAILLSHIYFSVLTTPGAEDPDEGVIDTMARTAAHEFGHFLRLSTRAEKYATYQTGHDDELGVYIVKLKLYGKNKYPPIKPNKTAQALMRSGDQVKDVLRPPGRWMRHEDWDMANRQARILKP